MCGLTCHERHVRLLQYVHPQVGSHYDPMIAKVITQGADRTEALARMTTALGEIEVIRAFGTCHDVYALSCS